MEQGKYILTEIYEKLDIYELVPELFIPSYISHWAALHFHHMTDQAPRTVFLSTTKRKRTFELQGHWIRYVTIKPEMFFGYERYGKVTVSDPEKTIIDCIRKPEYSGGMDQIFQAIDDELVMERLIEYCQRIKSSTVSSRLGYMLDLKGLRFDEDALRSSITTYSRLDPQRDSMDPDSKWKLYINRELPC